MDGIGVLVIWLLLCYAVTVYAGKKGRSQIGVFYSLFVPEPLSSVSSWSQSVPPIRKGWDLRSARPARSS